MIVLINPNSTESMTLSMLEAARAAAPGAQLEGWTNHDGPPAIQGEADGAAATPPMLALVRRASDAGAAAVIIGCFDDTGLAEAQALAACPVIGIGQAAYHLAAMIGGRFSVVTTLAVSAPILEENVLRYGLGPQLARIRASGVPVLAVERSEARVLEEIRAAKEEDGVTAVALGCGGMATLAARAQAETGVRVVDGVRAAAAAAAALL